MEEKQGIKISLSTFFLLLALIVIVIMGYFIFKLYTDNQICYTAIEELNNKINNFENNKNEQNYLNNTENKIEELDVNDTVVSNLYGYILKCDDFDYSFAWQNSLEPASFYKDTKTTYESLSEMEKVLAVLRSYRISEVKQVYKSQLKNILNIDYMHDYVSIYENIDQKTKAIFNQTNSNWKNYTGCSGQLDYKNNCYYLSEFDGGGKGTSISAYAELQKAEKDKEFIYIYDKYIYVDSTNYDIGEGDSKIHIYTSADETDDIGIESEYSIKINELYKKYENKLKTYKHSFKKAEDGSYYWYSTEPVK